VIFNLTCELAHAARSNGMLTLGGSGLRQCYFLSPQSCNCPNGGNADEISETRPFAGVLQQRKFAISAFVRLSFERCQPQFGDLLHNFAGPSELLRPFDFRVQCSPP